MVNREESENAIEARPRHCLLDDVRGVLTTTTSVEGTAITYRFIGSYIFLPYSTEN